MFPESRTDASADAAQLTPVLVGRQASLTPEAIAVEHGRQRMTYAELDARSNRLAHLLRAQGAGPDLPVGVRLARGLDLVVGLLAIWRAGAAYLPLDTEAPRSRTSALIAASGTALVLTDARGSAAVTDAGARPVVPEDLAAELREQPADAPVTGVHSTNAAYVLHTSGSTGTPKGVVVSHAGIANRIGWAVRQHELSTADRVLQKTALVFDAHVWEVFAPLVSGGTLVLAPAGAERDPAALVRAVGEHRITVLQVVPSVLRLLVAEDGWQKCGALRLVCSAGEPLHAELAHRLRAVSDAELWNTYGPTECSIDVTAHRFDPAQLTGPVPIGRPIEKMRVLVVDASGSPVGVGVPGELLAGGAGVARGYLGRPGQTAERFVPDPFAKDGSRLYRTGDRVSWRADGVLEYLGRMDDQVKVNGVRIEPAEVEAQLAAHPAIAGAVVRPYAAADGAKRLAAYYVIREPVAETELRGHLLERLPSTHVPAALIELESFPLGPTGKVDRRALPSPDAVAEPAGTAPATEAELLVAEAWRSVLDFGPLTTSSDFFRGGGTSLQLTRVAARLRAGTGRDISLRVLLGAPTLAGHAALLTAAAGEDAAPVRPVSREGGLPLSYGQRRLWFMDKMHPASPEWVAGLLLKVPAGTASELVGRALDTLVARHEALRTRYAEVDGEPRQFIEAPTGVPIRAITTGREGLPAVLAELLGTGFRLDGGELLRAAHITLDDDSELLAVAMHHITTDGWSTAVLEREFHQVLAALTVGEQPVLPQLAVQYADFAAWQQERLTGEAVGRELTHWRAVLDGHQPLALPTDHPRPAVRDGRGGITPVTIDAGTLAAVDTIAREHGTTRFTVLLTAYATVLARHSGQWDLPVGTPVAGRERPELDGVVGFFLNNVVLRCVLDGELGFNDAVARVAAITRDAFSHQDLPFDLLVDELAPDRDLSRTPLYQAAFDLHGEDFNGTVDGDTETVRRMWRITHTDLTLLLRPAADGTLVGGLEYATSLYEEATAARLAAGLTTLLASATADPDRALGALDLLTPGEHAELTRWGTAETPQPVMSTPQMFAAQAVRTPHATAVEGDGFALTYRELAARAARIARHLRSIGVHRGSTVGVLLDRGPELHATLLAVWQAGAAYVPIDPAFPVERVTGMLADADARVLITQNAYETGVFDGTVVRIDGADADAIAAQDAWTPPLEAHFEDLAYIIYTSGSTGRPKGVAVSHRGLANHLNWAAAELAGAGTGGSAVFSSAAFDLVVPNLWAPLLTGRRVLLLPQDLDLSELGERLAAHAPFSFLKLTPGHLDVLTQQLTERQAAALAPVVVVAGEALDGSLAATWASLLGEGGRLINEYGPTEASVGTSVHPVATGTGPGVVPIGGPLPGMVMRVLDERMRPVPVGAVGELYVGGTGVARGYVGRPGLTAEKFLPDPYGPAGTRLYRTGDLARWLDGGAVEFLGRTDDQVKIRGYRVETGEIRAVLLDHPGVADAVVVPVGSGARVRLAAYFTAVPGGDADAASLAAHSALLLPPYMVPGSFTELERIPLNPNGKVDRRALPEPVAAEPPRRARPANPVEERLLDIWRDACGIEAGLDDNFFHAGGNSILAIRLIAAIQTDFEITLPVRAVFEGPTVAELAQTIEDRIRAEIAEMSDCEVMADSMLLKEQNA
ncbi:amino acid adenylation domain-containing protein [Streptomyces mirabilis]|uniref:amino acid adenylation domain-containing protein n=1 Tax=Streptomyces mirabilis TaxID=68239 RepID=UPI00367CF99C